MSLLQTRRLALGLALSLLWPATAFAQMPPAPAQADAQQVQLKQVQLKVDFVTVSTADLDKSGVAFDRVPLAQPTANPGPTGPFLQYATGDIVAQLLRTMSRTPGKVVQAPVITTTNNVPATIQINTQTPDRKAGFLPIHGGLTITPRVNTDGSITLSVASRVADVNATTPAAEPPGTIRSGDVMAVAGLPFSPDRSSSDQRLLVFVTPTRLGTDAQKTDAGQPGLPSPPVRDTCSTTGRTVSSDVFNANLRSVVAMLERQVGIKALVPGGQTYKPVYVHLVSASLPKALAAIARSAGAQVTKNADGVYVFSPLPISMRTPTPAAPTDANSPSVVVNGSSVTVTP